MRENRPEPQRHDADAKRHPIRVAARRTGLSTDLLRAWERRYGVVEPGRTEGGRRLYSDRDIERLRLLKAATDAGRSIGRVAELAIDDVARLVREDREAERAERGGSREGGEDAAEYLAESLDAIAGLDVARLDAALSRATVALRPVVVIEDVVAPLMRRIGEAWAAGRLMPGHERLASGAVRSALAEMIGALAGTAPAAPLLLAATPTGQAHEIGALLAAATAAAAGWRVTYLGPDLPASDIASAARQTRARAVALSLVYPSGDPRVEAAVRELARSLPSDSALLVGGAAARSYREALDSVGVRALRDTQALHAVLRTLDGDGWEGEERRT
jgi:DNA-binding transcriptional MerR regulator